MFKIIQEESFEEYCLFNDIEEPTKHDYFNYKERYYTFEEFLINNVDVDQELIEERYIEILWLKYNDDYINYCNQWNYLRDYYVFE